MPMKEKNIDYFNIEGTPGGNQDWCTDFWMHLGGCGALAACDMAICLKKNKGDKNVIPYDPDHMTKQEYLNLSMTMKPYIHPRLGGVTKLHYYTDGFGKYLRERGYQVSFHTLSGNEPYEKAAAFVKESIDRNLPVAYLMLRHKDPEFEDLNWHWFMITGYSYDEQARMFLTYHTYGEVEKVDFEKLWNTGMYFRGGLVSMDQVTGAA